MLRPLFRLLARWHLGAARRTVARYLAGDLSLDQAAVPLRRSLEKYGWYHHLGMPALPAGSGSLEVFSLMPDGSYENDPRVDELIERGKELELGPVEYQRRRELQQRALREIHEERRRARGDESEGAV